MATNAYNQNYKYTYSKEVDLLDSLVNKIEEAANNLDTNAIESLMSNFKSQTYSLLRPSNQQYFDELVSYTAVLLSNIKKRKALAEQWEKKRQIIENSYKRLQQIKKNVTNAKTVSELEKAKKQYERWKSESSRIKFGWEYNKKVDSAKSYILEKIGPEDAINELKNLLEKAKHSDNGFENDSTIKSWTAKYPLDCFHEVYKKEVNNLIQEGLSLIKEPILENEQNNSNVSLEGIPSILLINPTQSHAVNNLRKIMNRNPKDFTSLLQWIYTYRNLPFDGPYKQSISTLIPADYGINLNNTYSIPSFETNDLNSKEIDNLVKDTVINYFGIMLCGNNLSSSKKHVVSDTYKRSQTSTAISKICDNDKITDEILQTDNPPIVEIDTFTTENEAEEDIKTQIDTFTTKNETEDDVKTQTDIFATKNETEDDVKTQTDTFTTENEAKDDVKTQIEDSSQSNNISENKNKIEIEVQISSILPEIEFDEKQFISSSDNEENIKTEEPKKSSDDILIEPYISPYSLTSEDIQNIESIYTFVQPEVEKIPIEQPKLPEDSIKYTPQKIIDIDNQN